MPRVHLCTLFLFEDSVISKILFLLANIFQSIQDNFVLILNIYITNENITLLLSFPVIFPKKYLFEKRKEKKVNKNNNTLGICE